MASPTSHFLPNAFSLADADHDDDDDDDGPRGARQ